MCRWVATRRVVTELRLLARRARCKLRDLRSRAGRRRHPPEQESRLRGPGTVHHERPLAGSRRFAAVADGDVVIGGYCASSVGQASYHSINGRAADSGRRGVLPRECDRLVVASARW